MGSNTKETISELKPRNSKTTISLDDTIYSVINHSSHTLFLEDTWSGIYFTKKGKHKNFWVYSMKVGLVVYVDIFNEDDPRCITS